MEKKDREFQLKLQRHILEQAKSKKLANEMMVSRLKEEITLEIPKLQKEEDIAELQDLIKRKKAKLNDGKEEEAKPSDMLAMKLILKDYKKQAKLDLPMKQKRWELRDVELSQDPVAQSCHASVIKEIEKRIKQLERNEFPAMDVPKGVG